jgi:hypothetical protein
MFEINAADFKGIDLFDSIRLALASLTADGQTIVAPPGVYSVATNLVIASRPVRLLLDGVTVNFKGTGKAINLSTYTFEMRGLTLVGPGKSTQTCGIQQLIGDNNRYTRMAIEGFGTGLVLSGGDNLGRGSYYNVFDQIWVNKNSYGFKLSPLISSYCNANAFFGCQGSANDNDGWIIDGANGNYFYACYAESNGGYGINMWSSPNMGTKDNNFYGTWLEANKKGNVNEKSGNWFGGSWF